MACSLGQRSKEYKVDVSEKSIEHTTDWRSIYIVGLVAFIGSVHSHCISPGVWPYMKLLIPDVTETFYGLMNSTLSTGIVISALIAGYVSNMLKNTTQPMIFAKIMAIFSCCLYMMIELVGVDARRAFFLLFKLMLGISVGAANIYRTHVAMASTEADRPKAVGICSLAPAVGIFIGPLGQIVFTTLGYPGVPFFFGTHINLYTAPILFTILISIVGVFLLTFCFNGKMRVHNDVAPLKTRSENESISSNSLDTMKYDKMAVFICLYTKMLINLCLLNFTAIGVPYAMLAFEWTSEKSVLYISICMFLVGINICFWNLAYIFLNLRNRLSERRAIIIGIFSLLVAYLLTYPWPFIKETIPYQVNSTGSGSEIGCKHEFEWCATTPRVNMWMFLGSLITVLGFAIPLSQINLDILFSKVLGNIKQGTHQGLMIVSGEALSIVGPIVLTKVYTISGPTYIWLFEIVVIVVSIILWIVFYKRMVGKSKRLADSQLN